jgi:hypothetical protein
LDHVDVASDVCEALERGSPAAGEALTALSPAQLGAPPKTYKDGSLKAPLSQRSQALKRVEELEVRSTGGPPPSRLPGH